MKGETKVTNIPIEKGIPVPTSQFSFVGKYPWKELKVGDSFLIPRESSEPSQLTRDRASKAVQYGKRTGFKFCTRSVADGVRVWRIE